MAKQQQQNKLQQNNKGELLVEQNVAIDDSLLPSALELEKLKEVDPAIIPWVMRRTEIEQDARIENNKEILKINKIRIVGINRFNFTALILSFTLFVLLILLSGYLVHSGFSLEGSIFGGSTIIIALVYFLKVIQKSRNNHN